MSWLFSQALLAAYSGANSWDGGPLAQLSLTPMPQAFSWPDKTTEAWIRFPSGMMCEPFTLGLGSIVLTWFQAGFRAKISPFQAAARASTGRGVASGFTWPGSFAKWNPDTCSWRTRQHSLLGGLTEFSETWPKWGSMRSGECLQRETLGPRISGNGSGLLPTLQARDWKSGKAGPGTMARNARPLSEVLGGLLNPPWAEWFMGFPEGWTGLEPLGMHRFQQWQRSHGLNSHEGSTDEDPQEEVQEDRLP